MRHMSRHILKGAKMYLNILWNCSTSAIQTNSSKMSERKVWFYARWQRSNIIKEFKEKDCQSYRVYTLLIYHSRVRTQDLQGLEKFTVYWHWERLKKCASTRRKVNLEGNQGIQNTVVRKKDLVKYICKFSCWWKKSFFVVPV